eukprot:5908618-Alexandrium_andersonii.AAC.1
MCIRDRVVGVVVAPAAVAGPVLVIAAVAVAAIPLATAASGSPAHDCVGRSWQERPVEARRFPTAKA